MVEIKRSLSNRPPSVTPSAEDAKYRLVYTKSKVYVNPTAYARDNIPGFVALVKRASRYDLLCLTVFLTLRFTGGRQPKLSPFLDSRDSVEREGSRRMGQVCEDRR
jgi:hypothetical protein